jgi:hypothetical protein
MPLLAIPDASRFLTGSFTTMAVVLAVIWVIAVDLAGRRLREPRAVRRPWTIGTSVAAGVWMGLTWAAAETGHLSRPDLTPPPFLGLPVAVLALSLMASFSRFGTRLIDGLPLAWIIGVQAFRFPLELMMHRAYDEGVMPMQMSYSGWNFDIVTGLTALPVTWAVSRGFGGRKLVIAWNALGTLLLVNIVVIAVVSMPIVGWFGPSLLNTFVMFPPFVWLPAVMVTTAAVGHLLVWRAVLRKTSN